MRNSSNEIPQDYLTNTKISHTGEPSINELRTHIKRADTEKEFAKRGRMQETLKSMNIDETTVQLAEQKQIITPEQKNILELALKGYSLQQILESQSDLFTLYNITKIFTKGVKLIQSNFPDIQPKSKIEKGFSEETNSASDSILQQTLIQEENSLSVNPAVYEGRSILRWHIDNQLTFDEVKSAYEKNPTLKPHFAALVLFLQGHTNADIKKILHLHMGSSSDLYSSAINKVMKDRKEKNKDYSSAA